MSPYNLSCPLLLIKMLELQEVDLGYLGKVTHGFSGADLTEVCQRVCPFQDYFPPFIPAPSQTDYDESFVSLC